MILYVPHGTRHGTTALVLGASTEWPGVEKVDIEIAEVEALAAKHPDVATDLRAFQRRYRRLTSIVTEAL